MKQIAAKAVSSGVAVGPIVYIEREIADVQKRCIADPEAEAARFARANAQAIEELGELARRAEETLGKENAALFEAHQMMLEDEDYQQGVTAVITDEKACAEYAVERTSRQFAAVFAAMDDDYMKARAADVLDVATRVIEILSGRRSNDKAPDSPAIYASEDFSPSETAQMDRTKVLALLSRGGSENSHTAIFARTMGIPAIIGIDEDLRALAGHIAAVDGKTGAILIDPDEATIASFRAKLAEQEDRRRRLQALKGLETVTRDGQKADLFANIGSVEDARLALAQDAEGIGLFRSEFLYLQAAVYPSEQTQFEAYKAVLQLLKRKKVVIRTLDIGADKQIGYFHMDKEENPALGYRAIRICLDRPDVFKTQLRALLRASAYGTLAIMLPMITSAWEVREAKAIVNEVKAQLDREGIAYDPKAELGIMIETPASVLVSDKLAKEADFFSVGTNDLTQYTLAVDRQNDRLARFFDPHHLGLLRMIKRAADSIHKEGKWIGICGELAADPAMTELFLAMGIDELSVSPGRLLSLKEHIRSIDLSGRREEILRQLAWD